MSKVPTWVRALDGAYYEDPVLRGPDWYLCFDDDDPPEFVMDPLKLYRSKEEYREQATKILTEAGLKNWTFTSGPRFSDRLFGKNSTAFKQGASFFLKLTEPIPVPLEFSAKSTFEEVCLTGCVIYTFESVGA